MRKTTFVSAVVLAALAGAVSSAASAQATMAAANNTPLSFGMKADDVSRVLGTTLHYVRGRPGDELYLALPNVNGAALSDRRDGLYLQFRHFRLEGWKGDWGSSRPGCD